MREGDKDLSKVAKKVYEQRIARLVDGGRADEIKKIEAYLRKRGRI